MSTNPSTCTTPLLHGKLKDVLNESNNNSDLVHQTVSLELSEGEASTQNICSMETCPVDSLYDSADDDDSQPPIWGRLFPLGTSFTPFGMHNDTYIFGRGDDNDYQFTTTNVKKNQCFQAYSKTHFKLSKVNETTGQIVFLHDLSSNGTYINSALVGKGKKHVLNNNDEISLAIPKNKAFVYMDPNSNEENDLPQALREKYTLTKLLGRGACGEVKLAFEKGTCKKYAVKIISKKTFTLGGKNTIDTAHNVSREVDIMKDLNHPCIIRVEDVIDTPEKLYLILELVEGGELFDRVVSVEQFDEPTAKMLFYQMVHAIKYLHDQNITHRDLKPENILLCDPESNDTLIKVTDFGLSRFVDTVSLMKTFCGTPNYLAPEILASQGTGAYTNAVDAWSLGVILFICLVGYPPFSDERTDMTLNKQILEGHVEFPEQFWSNISSSAVDLVRKFLTVDDKKRITLSEALEHPWLKDDLATTAAHKLMYPDTCMSPPAVLPRKRNGEDFDSPKRKAPGRLDNGAEATTPSVSSS